MHEGTLLELIRPRGFWEDKKTAFLFWDGKSPHFGLEALSYAGLRKKAERFACSLLELGVKPGDRLAVMLPNTPQFPVVYFGALAAGVIAVPINPLCARSPEEITKILIDSGAQSIVALDLFLPALKHIGLENLIVTTIADALPPIKKIGYLVQALCQGNYFYYPDKKNPRVRSYAEMICGGGEKFLKKIAPKDAAILLYTSGTTGDPKGVEHTHESLFENALACKKLISELGMEDGKEIFLAAAPYFHIMGLAAMLHAPLAMRAKIVLVPKPDQDKFKTMLEAISRTRATGFVGIPGFFEGMANALGKNPELYDISSLKVCISGAARMDPEVKKNFETFWGKKILIGYGLTEAGVTHCQRAGNENDTVGLPLDGVEEKFADTDENFVGELCVRSKGNMRGYWNKPDKTRGVLCSENWFLTGDLAKVGADGNVAIFGRADSDFVKGRAGEKISLNEVEKVLMMHAQIVDAAVVGKTGKETRRGYTLEAFVVLRDPETICCDIIKSQLTELCRQRLVLAQRPDEIKCVKIIPRSPMGKVLKKNLRPS